MRIVKKPLFQQRHYEAIAELLRKEIKPNGTMWGDDFDIIVDEFARMFRNDNSNFKPDKFNKAAGRNK